ncbi:hypothetical protein [Streptomyces prasinopilosus]|uniref:Uncharacterized protein n=1 Tax=Streptomyces prasinopilosus TaxID=67344 RepID=A0A1G6ZLA1_9ACTN|nr:hypothetical protein [Streptomyces prasinopilosus]SDE02585.1 hypothetical protein SAMN05216505_11544 [Streptomyces prasinopilosus]
MPAQPGTEVPTGGEADGTDEVAELFRAPGRRIEVARERTGPSRPAADRPALVPESGGAVPEEAVRVFAERAAGRTPDSSTGGMS